MDLKFEPISWLDIEGKVKKLNPELHRIITKLAPDASYRIYRARYPFGTVFVENGLFKVPDKNGKLRPTSSDHLPSQVREDLSYNKGTNPVTLLLSNQAELYIEEGLFDIPISFGLINPGHLLSTTYILSPDVKFQPKFKWSISAGARSIFCLPKLTNNRSFLKLKKSLNIRCEVPKKYSDHFSLFKEIAKVSDSSWCMDVLFFSKKWFEKLDDTLWRDFYNYMLIRYQSSYQPFMNKFIWDIVWAFIIKKKGLKPSLYIANTIKHLLFMAAGSTAGMGPAIDNKAAPIDLFQKTILDVFAIKQYLPTIFIPKRFDMYSPQNHPVYYSLNFPNMMEMTLRPRKHESLLTDLYETYSMLNKYIPELREAEYNLVDTPLYDIPKRVEFSAFHEKAEPYHSLRGLESLTLEDENLCKILYAVDRSLEFNHHAAFFKGCIRLGHMK